MEQLKLNFSKPRKRGDADHEKVRMIERLQFQTQDLPLIPRAQYSDSILCAQNVTYVISMTLYMLFLRIVPLEICPLVLQLPAVKSLVLEFLYRR